MSKLVLYLLISAVLYYVTQLFFYFNNVTVRFAVIMFSHFEKWPRIPIFMYPVISGE